MPVQIHRIAAAAALLQAVFFGGGLACAVEDPVESRTVREHRERLATGRSRDLQATVQQMVASPHSRWVDLLAEALLRAVRIVDRAQQRLPEAERDLSELRAEVSAARKATSPSKQKRLQQKLDVVQLEFDQAQAQLTIQLRAQDLLLKGISRVSKGLNEDGRGELAESFSRRLERLRDPLDRITLLRAMGSAPGSATSLVLMRLIRDPLEKPDPIVAALRALIEHSDPASLPAGIAALDHRDWRVRSEALELIRLLHRRTSIPFLVQRLATAEGRIRDDIGRALNSLTGQNFAADGRFWQLWWTENRVRFVMPSKPQVRVVDVEEASGGVHFYGISTSSRRVLFVLDVSGSMAEPARVYSGKGGGTRSRKIDVARRNLRQALMALPEDAWFNVILYAGAVEPVFEEVQFATEENKAEALAQVMAREPGGGTNIYAAVVETFDQARRVERRSRKDASPRIDTVYFLTDGQPTAGTVRSPDLILREAQSRNALLRLRIHSVGVGAHDKAFMKRLAEEHGGTYIAQ